MNLTSRTGARCATKRRMGRLWRTFHTTTTPSASPDTRHSTDDTGPADTIGSAGLVANAVDGTFSKLTQLTWLRWVRRTKRGVGTVGEVPMSRATKAIVSEPLFPLGFVVVSGFLS